MKQAWEGPRGGGQVGPWRWARAWSRWLALCVALWILWTGSVALGQAGRTVDGLLVEGNRRVEAEAILRNVRQREGEPLSFDQVSRDIRAIYALGFFEDIQVDARQVDGKLFIVFLVQEKPSISSISYKGNDELDEEELKEVVDLRPFSILDVSRIKANEDKIRKLYAEKGFFLTEVKGLVEPVEGSTDEVQVIFQVDEYTKVQVRDVAFLGNEAIPDETLANIMETRVGHAFSFLTNFGVFKEASFETDLERLTAYYYNEGYINVKVGQPTLRLSRDKQYLFITIPISEGEQHFVDSVDITGDFLPDHPREELLPKLKLRVEEPAAGEEPKPKVFSYGSLREDVTALKDLYQDQGYAYANINPVPRVDPKTHRVALNYDIQKGPRVYFGRIEVIGNNKTRDKVLRRELLFSEGDLFNSTLIKRSKARVQRLGFFETVDITTTQSQRKDVVDVKITVAERPTGTFQVGAGFSSVENFIAMAQISQNNLFGRGQTLSLQATLSSIRTLFNLRFSEPYLFDTRWQLSVDLYDFEFIFNDFTRSSTGGSLTVGYPLPRPWMDALGLWGDLSLAGTYKLEEVDVQVGGRNGTRNSATSRLFSGGLTSSVQGSLFWDTRDNRLFPTDGFFHTLSVEAADDLTLSENEFVRYTADSRWYFPVFWQFVLKFNGEIGVVQSTARNKPVPIFERFFLGGPNSIRGFQRATLGPSREVAGNTGDPGTQLSDFNIGGNKKLVLNAELEFPIFASVGIRGVFFLDMGNAFDDGKSFAFIPDLFADPDEDFANTLRTAWGLGFRWFSPIGPLRFEWGFPMRRLRNEDPYVFEFSIGNSF